MERLPPDPLPISPSPILLTRSWHARWFYRASHVVASVVFSILFRLRIEGRNHVPSGGMLLCSNHQSHLDPVLVGLSCPDPITFLARADLFVGPFATLIRYMGAIPINREGMGLAGVKRTLERLKRGEKVLIFPEGTRTPNGQMQPLKGGFSVIARRAKVPMLPIAIAGAYQAWPRKRWFPLPHSIQVVVGEALSVEEISGLSDDQVTVLLEERLRACWTQAHQRLEHRTNQKIT